MKSLEITSEYMLAEYELRLKIFKETRESLDKLKNSLSRLEKSTSNLYSVLYKCLNKTL